jgi:hypothetical protein
MIVGCARQLQTRASITSLVRLKERSRLGGSSNIQRSDGMTIGSESAAAPYELAWKDVDVVLAMTPKNAAPSTRTVRLDFDHDT